MGAHPGPRGWLPAWRCVAPPSASRPSPTLSLCRVLPGLLPLLSCLSILQVALLKFLFRSIICFLGSRSASSRSPPSPVILHRVHNQMAPPLSSTPFLSSFVLPCPPLPAYISLKASPAAPFGPPPLLGFPQVMMWLPEWNGGPDRHERKLAICPNANLG